MNQDDIVRMMAEVLQHDPGYTAWTLSTPHLQLLVSKAIEAEREACALVAESYEPTCDNCPRGVANAIRARGKR